MAMVKSINVKDAITDEGLAHFIAAYAGQIPLWKEGCQSETDGVSKKGHLPLSTSSSGLTRGSMQGVDSPVKLGNDEMSTGNDFVASNNAITKEDIFYYIYGLLHSTEYIDKYADNLTKELPRIPCVKDIKDFWAFSSSGRELAKLHINYETVPMYPATVSGGTQPSDYIVTKMKYGVKPSETGKGKDKDLTTLHYNAKITVTGIPLEAYEYVVNGKPALNWIVERYCNKVDKDSQIVNDANKWADDCKYPLELFLRVITVSMETLKIVKNLPKLVI